MTAGTNLLQSVQPPKSLEAEQSVLGALLIDNACWDVVGTLLAQADFADLQHRSMWVAIERLVVAGKPADVITVHEALKAAGRADEDALGYLNAVAMSVPSSTNAKRYAEIVRELSLRRELLKQAAALADAALDRTQALEQTLDRSAQSLLAMGQGATTAREPQPLQTVVVRFMDQLNAACEGHNPAIATGLKDLDDRTAGGARRGELWVIGARPSMGKSAMTLTLGLNVARRVVGVLLQSQEDNDTTLMSRAIAHLGRINLADLRNPVACQDPARMWGSVTEAVEEMKHWPILIDDQGGLTMADVRRKVLQARRQLGGRLGLVVVDYLQLMSGEGDNRNQMLGAIATGLKTLAKEQNLWVVLLSQLNRKAEERPGVPQLSDLRDSGDIEAAADVILLLHREAMRKKDLPPDWKHYAQVHLAKQKNGPVSVLPLHFNGVHQIFSDWHGPAPMGRTLSSNSGGGLE